MIETTSRKQDTSSLLRVLPLEKVPIPSMGTRKRRFKSPSFLGKVSAAFDTVMPHEKTPAYFEKPTRLLFRATLDTLKGKQESEWQLIEPRLTQILETTRQAEDSAQESQTCQRKRKIVHFHLM